MVEENTSSVAEDFPKELGRMEQEYLPGSATLIAAMVGGVLVALGLGGFLIFSLLQDGLPKTAIGWTVLAAAVIGTVLTPLVIVFVLLGRLRWRLYLFENGLGFRYRKSSRAVTWDEVKYLYEIRLTVNGVPTGHRVYLRTEDNTLLALDGTFRGVSSAAAALKDRVAPRLAAKAAHALGAGEPVPFGKLTLAPDGLRQGDKLLPWEEVAAKIERRSEGRVLVIRKAGKWGIWYEQPLANFPNVELFLNLLGRFVDIKM
jgi:Family of unknown function (DUF6585)